MSPFAVTSLLAMVFLGARGPTSGQMNDILRLDDMVTFNPHQVFRNVTESVVLSRTQGVAAAAFVRELYSDRVSQMEFCTATLFLLTFSHFHGFGPVSNSDTKLNL
jgi:serine protease inhibitor